MSGPLHDGGSSDDPASLASVTAGLVSDRAGIAALLAGVKVIALVGASPNEARPSYGVMKFLLSRGYRVIPVNPGQAGKTLLGETCHATLADIPEPVDMVDIFRASEAVPGIVDEALALVPQPRVIWTQLGVRHDAAAAKAVAAGMAVVMDHCPKIELLR